MNVMRIFFPAVVVAALAAAVPASAQETEQERQEQMGPWKEMNAFHMALGPIWHPIEESGDLTALRARIDGLVAAADAWAASKAPAACADVKPEAVAGIAKDVHALAKLLADQTPDEKLRAAVEALHEKFEPIETTCVVKKQGA